MRTAADARVVRLRARTLVIVFGCLLWLAAGVALLVLLAPTATAPGRDGWIMLAGCTALALAFGVARLEFRSAGGRIQVSPDAGFLVLIAIVVPPPWAMLAGGIASLRNIRRAGSRFEAAFNAATGAIATGMASLVAHETFTGAAPVGREVLAAAVSAAIVRSLVQLTGQLLLAETLTVGGALAVFRETPVATILVLEAGLPAATVAMAAPFLNEPILAMLVVLAGQLLTWRVLRVQHEQFVGSHAQTQLLEVLHRYVPTHVADAVLARRGQPGELASAGQQRDLTVMFIDIRGFTTWAERTAPGEVFTELNELLGDLADSILATDGTIDKFTGDGLMAFWNAPSDQPDHAKRAIQTLPGLLMRVREFNLRREAQRSVELGIGIGIATGPAMVGDIGHRDRLAYTAIGDTVNLAARLEQSTRDLGVPALIDERTFLALPLPLQRQFQRLEGIEVKGRSERVRTYTPIALARHRSVVA